MFMKNEIVINGEENLESSEMFALTRKATDWRPIYGHDYSGFSGNVDGIIIVEVLMRSYPRHYKIRVRTAENVLGESGYCDESVVESYIQAKKMYDGGLKQKRMREIKKARAEIGGSRRGI